VEGDITACFDEISHPALMDRVRSRIADKRVLALVKAFLKAGILTEGGEDRSYVYTYPAKKALRAICRKVKDVCRTTSINQPLSTLLHRLNPVLRGWCVYFQPGVSSKTFGYLASLVWRQVMAWIRRKHRKVGWKAIRRRYCNGGWWPAEGRVTLLHTGSIPTVRCRYRGAAIPSPWQATR
jgi:RNA-directed DNA polymerase